MSKPFKAWVVFWIDKDGNEYSADAIGSSKEQAWSRARRCFPDSTDWSGCKVRRVTMTIHRPAKKRTTP